MKRRLFWIKISKILQGGSLLANTDETAIGRDSQISYSWSPKGVPSEFKNQPFVGSLNMVFTILSNGAWFWLMLNQTTNSEIFSEYIWNLMIGLMKITILALKTWSLCLTIDQFIEVEITWD